MNTPNDILREIESRIVTLTLLGGLDRDEATTKAIIDVAKEYRLEPKAIAALPKATYTSPGDVDDAQVKVDARFMMEYFMRDFPTELLTGIEREGDWADWSDERLEALVNKDFGFAP
jgi:hypothetical protein